MKNYHLPRVRVNKSSEHQTIREVQHNCGFGQTVCFICKRPLTMEDYIDNIKTIYQNGRPVRVHRLCPKK